MSEIPIPQEEQKGIHELRKERRERFCNMKGGNLRRLSRKKKISAGVPDVDSENAGIAGKVRPVAKRGSVPRT